MKSITLRLAGIMLASLPVAGPAADEPAKPADRPNILLIVADDLATRIGCYGDKAAMTPNLDRLAGEGVLFDRAYAQGSVCTPSRTSFMLGLNNRHADAEFFKRHPDTMTMGRWFREHGYQTFSVGKVDHDETYTDPKAWDIRVPITDCKMRAPQHPLESVDEDMGGKRRTGLRFTVEENIEALSDWARTERALQFLENDRNPRKPFFAIVGFHNPHDPWETTKTIHGSLDSAKLTPEWPPPADVTPLPPKALFDVPGMEMSDSRQREYQRLYYAAVTLLDQQIGRILAKLRSEGLLENTVIVFTSDQGFHLGWRGQWHKHTIDEQVLRVPLIVRQPQGVKGAKADGIVELLDLFPTFCDLAGVPVPDTLDGISFLSLLKNPKAVGKPAAFCSMPPMWGNGRTVRTEQWRLVERLDGSCELYDLAHDPMEYHNVITNAAHAEVVTRLHALLEKEFGPILENQPFTSNTEIQK